MARRIKLLDENENVIHSWTGATLDVSEVITIVYPFDNSFINAIRLVAPLKSVNILNHSVYVNYKSGFSLVVDP